MFLIPIFQLSDLLHYELFYNKTTSKMASTIRLKPSVNTKKMHLPS